jgi:general secretion pathway protein K
MSARHPPRLRQRGAAILIAMLIMTLVATLAAGMVWLQWRGIEVETAERARGQGEWLLNAALDWGNLILKSSIRNGHAEDDLTQPWATPLAETKLSSFLSADGTHSDDSGPEAFLTGQITDAQSKYNLYDLVIDPTQGRTELLRLQKLCDAIGVSQQVAQQIVSGFAESYSAQAASAPGGPSQTGATTAALMPREVGDLVWFGIDPKVVKQLEPFIEIIPLSGTTQVHINANTAPAEVLMAADESITRAVAEQMIQKRQQKPFMTTAEARAAGGIGATGNLPTGGTPAFQSLLDVQSSYFEIYGQLRYEQNVIRERSVVYRVSPAVVQVLRRERLPPDAPA